MTYNKKDIRQLQKTAVKKNCSGLSGPAQKTGQLTLSPGLFMIDKIVLFA